MVEKIFKAIGGVVGDFATIDVVTLTGNVTLNPAAGAVKPENFYAKLTEQISEVKVVGVTHREITFDEVNFFATVDGVVTDELRQLHVESVRAVSEARQSVIELIKDAVLAAVPGK